VKFKQAGKTVNYRCPVFVLRKGIPLETRIVYLSAVIVGYLIPRVMLRAA
jgi:hypothetical protein